MLQDKLIFIFLAQNRRDEILEKTMGIKKNGGAKGFRQVDFRPGKFFFTCPEGQDVVNSLLCTADSSF